MNIVMGSKSDGSLVQIGVFGLWRNQGKQPGRRSHSQLTILTLPVIYGISAHLTVIEY